MGALERVAGLLPVIESEHGERLGVVARRTGTRFARLLELTPVRISMAGRAALRVDLGALDAGEVHQHVSTEMGLLPQPGRDLLCEALLVHRVAGLAGGIISVAVINHDFKTDNFQKIILDASTLMIIAMTILFAAAIVESYLTPVLF